MVLRTVACLVVGLCAACGEQFRSERVLTDDPVVMGISLSVIEDGPHAANIGPLPDDRLRAQVLPGDTVQLDALVANVDGVIPLDDAAWVLCGGVSEGCLSSVRRQGDRSGGLDECEDDSAAHSSACLAGRGDRPAVMMPAFATDAGSAVVGLFTRVGVIVGTPGGPTTDECIQQLVDGPQVSLWGCGVGVRELPYGPEWPLFELLGNRALIANNQLPEMLAQLLPPNAAPRVEEIKVGSADDFDREQDPELEPRSIDEVIDLEADAWVWLEPVVSAGDQQLELQPAGSNSWIAWPEEVRYNMWSDREVDGLFGSALFRGVGLTMPSEPGPMRVYVTATDGRGAISWFTLELQVLAR